MTTPPGRRALRTATVAAAVTALLLTAAPAQARGRDVGRFDRP